MDETKGSWGLNHAKLGFLNVILNAKDIPNEMLNFMGPKLERWYLRMTTNN